MIDEGVATDPAKIEACRGWPIPVDVRSSFELASYYRRFVVGFTTIAAPLVRFAEKSRDFRWTAEYQAACDELERRLTSAPVLIYPDPV